MTDAAVIPPLTARQTAWRLFVTAWMIFTLHFATNIAREIYPALALGDHLSFDLAGYCGLHPDLFETPGRGCHIGNNPGISMVAAIPYALARPVIDPLVRRVVAQRAASGQTEPPAFNSEFPNRRVFYAAAWRKGLDIKFGLAAFVMEAFCMAPLSAGAVVLMFFVLRAVLRTDRRALWLALLYAFGTPVLFRSAFLNHNLTLGHIAFAGIVLVWNPWGGTRLSARQRWFVAGLAGGTTLLFDYTGVVLVTILGAYVCLKQLREGGWSQAVRAGLVYVLGSLGPILLLWFYQYQAFGNPFLPGQAWMPPVEWIERGYRGYEFPPIPSLLGVLLFDYRFGLFVSAPILLLALAEPWMNRGERRVIPPLEEAVIFACAIGTWLFFGGSNYVRLQFNSGIRYLTAILPFLYLPAALVLSRLRPLAAWSWALAGLCVAWPLAMYREVERPLGILDPIVRTFSRGFSLPVLNVLSLTGGQYGDFFAKGTSPLPLFLLVGAVLYGIWSPRFRRPPSA